jgi:hypothetical protein
MGKLNRKKTEEEENLPEETESPKTSRKLFRFIVPQLLLLPSLLLTLFNSDF